MNVFEFLQRELLARSLPFLVIGGHAVNAYGYSRLTKDLDLLVRRTDWKRWRELLEKEGFAFLFDGGTFMQMSSPEKYRLPMDFMLVSDKTFGGMQGASKGIQIGTVMVRVPSLDHLLALKLHALKYGPPRRGYKDLIDVLSLVDANAIEIRSDKFRSLCEKYGSAEIYERILNFGPQA